MATWNIGSQVTAREHTILTSGNPFDNDGNVVEAGTLGIIVATHATAQGMDGRFARGLSVRFGAVTLLVGTDEVTLQDGAHGIVTALETARANVANAEHTLAAQRAWLAIVEQRAADADDGYCRIHDYFDCPYELTMEQMADALSATS